MFTGKREECSIMAIFQINIHFIRKAVQEYRLWHQLHVDQGKEFYLTLYVHTELRGQYGPSKIEPFRQTPPTQV